ncbi:O-antigen ligase [Glaciihabitans tibetensis]|uniref:O-antigen ligase n=2 Tax=Glaciihabitans tibetensis TaxID=1266600 RepID=A0A2T0VFG5_9MICO|nr:O-antigen ligase [Glaciihabitans tibetensis]
MESRTFLRFYAVFVLFTLFAADVWRHTLTWWGYSAIAGVLTIISIVLLIRQRAQWRLSALPLPLLAFVVLAVASVAWSAYPVGTLMGSGTTVVTVIAGLALAITFSRADLLWALGITMRIVLGGSLLFELFVAYVVRAPLLPLWVDYSSYGDDLPKLLFWSRDVMLDGGRIQGLVGSATLLGFLGLLGLIVFGVQFAARSVSRFWGGFWFLVAAVVVWLTRSGTISIAVVVVVAVLVAVLLLRAARSRGSRIAVYSAMAIAVLSVPAIIAGFSDQILQLLGKDSDLTGRIGIWNTVIGMAEQRPVFGWGWVSYWIPWIEPFDDLVIWAGVVQMHAHNAWLDLWMQLGIVGVVVFAALVLSTLLRTWWMAVDRPWVAAGVSAPYTAVTLLPLLVLVALLVQSAAESRLLVEYGLALLVFFAVSTKLPDRRDRLVSPATPIPLTAPNTVRR